MAPVLRSFNLLCDVAPSSRLSPVCSRRRRTPVKRMLLGALRANARSRGSKVDPDDTLARRGSDGELEQMTGLEETSSGRWIVSDDNLQIAHALLALAGELPASTPRDDEAGDVCQDGAFDLLDLATKDHTSGFRGDEMEAYEVDES